jgi:hypothetical protein
VFLQDRYEVNINETYGRLDGTPNGGLDNCTDKSPPKIRASLPPMAWQTFDIDFVAPPLRCRGQKDGTRPRHRASERRENLRQSAA